MPIFMNRLVDDKGGMMIGGTRPGGKGWRDRRESLLHKLARLHEVGPALEDQVDGRERRHRLRAHDVQAIDAVESVFDGDRYELFDLRSRKPQGERLDLTRGGANSGKTSTGAS